MRAAPAGRGQSSRALNRARFDAHTRAPASGGRGAPAGARRQEGRRAAAPPAAHERRRERRQAARNLRAAARGQSRAAHRTALSNPVRTAGRGDPLGAGHRQERQQGDRRACSAVANTPAADAGAWACAGSSRYIKSIGLYNSKAKNIIATCRLLLEQHGGEVPRDARGARTVAGRRAKDRQCRAEHGIRRSRPSRSTPIFFASPTAPDSRRARPCARSRTS